MADWPHFILLAGILIALCYAIDHWMMLRHRKRLHDKLLRFWDYLDDTSVPRLPQRLAGWTRNTLRRVFPKKLLPLLVALIISCLLTSLSIHLSYYKSGETRILLHPSSHSPWQWSLLYGINFAFDLVTVLITVRILAFIADTRRLPVVLLAIVADALIAVFLAVFCFWGASLIVYGRWADSSWQFLIAPMDAMYSCLSALVTPGFVPVRVGLGIAASVLLFVPLSSLGYYSATTLIPTMLYMAVLLFLFIARETLVVARKAGLYYCEVATEERPAKARPFTLLALALSIVVAIAKLVHGLATHGGG